MLIARMMYPVHSLGPGERIGLWVCGCHRRCPSCANPELWAFNEENEVPVETVLQILRSVSLTRPVTGLTVTGGEPFEQAEELCRLLEALGSELGDILVFTGYTLQELRERQEPSIAKLLQQISVLIDGAYMEEHNTNAPLRGSDNQVLHFLQPGVQEHYREYLAAGRAYQEFASDSAEYSVGLHHSGFRKALDAAMQDKGILLDTNKALR